MDRALQIQRENDMLRDKLSHIMRTTGGLDNWNYYDKKSLDKERRRSELLRITTENQMILSRLSQVRPNYNVKSWHDDWLRTLRLRDSIARFPRGRENLQKGEEKQDKSNSGCDKKQKMNTDATPARAKIHLKVLVLLMYKYHPHSVEKSFAPDEVQRKDKLR
ncbi:Hypothetical protein SMAX5B_018431 [Scophthalmus maximus]|uniref:Uncharacterized protein n=1 Tax=Scophthalmus maximus TaxID=52904 RepID=A0A2U9CCL9_SCOMX|nr:Hypothetical protein SMAX5B_018431 [Scophthalmus maximus]